MVFPGPIRETVLFLAAAGRVEPLDACCPSSKPARRSMMAIHTGHCGRITKCQGWKIVTGERMSTLKSHGSQYKDALFRYSKIRISQVLCTIREHQDRCIGRVWPRLASGTCPGCYSRPNKSAQIDPRVPRKGEISRHPGRHCGLFHTRPAQLQLFSSPSSRCARWSLTE